MKIDEVINLWNKSKYETLMIKSLPCINHLGELTYGTGVYTKGQMIVCGAEFQVEEYLSKIYNGSIFMLDEVDEYISFQMIIKE